MGFLDWKVKSKGICDDETLPGARSNSCVSLPRKPAFLVGEVEDGASQRDSFVIKASPAGPPPRSLGAPPGTAPPRAALREGPRSASVVVSPVAAALQPAAQSLPAPTQLLPEYRTSTQFSHKVVLYKGSISTVYKAHCSLTRAEVIIKQYIKERMSSRAVHKMRREIRLMYLLRSQPRVAHILGDFEDEEYFYIVMEHCAGGDLYHRMIIKGQLEEHWACKKVIIPLLGVLHYIHTEAHIVHRDIKPENLFLTKSDELRLGDFGLAIKQDEELPFLRAGTLDYMAPEVLDNRVVDDFTEAPVVTAADLQLAGLRQYDEKVDIWAVGILAFELVVGDAPFYHEEEKETVKLIKESKAIPFPAPMRISPWADFVRCALRKDPRDRPSALDLLGHPWIQQHAPTPLFAGLKRQHVTGGLGRAGSLPAGALAGAAAASSATGAAAAAPAADAGAKEGRQSLRIQVDVTGTLGVAASEAAALASEVPRSSSSGSGGGGSPALCAGACGRASCHGEAPAPLDDLIVDGRVSLAEVRRTRSTGEAQGLQHCGHGGRQHQHQPRPQHPPGGAAGVDLGANRCPSAAAARRCTSLLLVPGAEGEGLAAPAPAPAPRLGPTEEGEASLQAAVEAAEQGTCQEGAAESAVGASGSSHAVEAAGEAAAPATEGREAFPAPPAAPTAAPAPARPRTPQQAAPGLLAGGPLPPMVREAASIAARLKSLSLPKSPYAVRSLFGGSSDRPASPCASASPQAAAPPGSAGGSGGGGGSKILAAWGKKPSRLSVAAGSAPSSPVTPAGTGLPSQPASSATAGGLLHKSPGSSRAPVWGGSTTGSPAGTLEEVRGNAKSGSINRLKLYLSRQRAA